MAIDTDADYVFTREDVRNVLREEEALQKRAADEYVRDYTGQVVKIADQSGDPLIEEARDELIMNYNKYKSYSKLRDPFTDSENNLQIAKGVVLERKLRAFEAKAQRDQELRGATYESTYNVLEDKSRGGRRAELSPADEENMTRYARALGKDKKWVDDTLAE